MDGTRARRDNGAAMRIQDADSPEDIDAARRLFREYAAAVDAPACFVAFEDEVSALPGEYAPPRGRLLVAFSGDALAGCVALRRLADGSGEMKRLYVRAPYRRSGLGRQLAQRVIDASREAGSPRLVLDTLPVMAAAIRLYDSLGFREIGPYSDAPTPGARFFELSLSGSAPAAS